MHKDDFLEQHPDAEWLEDLNGCERWSDMQGEGSPTESMWFCQECGEEAHPFDPGECEGCALEEEASDIGKDGLLPQER